MLLVTMTGCGTASEKETTTGETTKTVNNNEKLKIGIVQPVEHPSLNELENILYLD